MPQLTAGDRFPNLRVNGVDGEVELRDRWRQGPLVVLFMRHFGCAFCRQQMIQVSRAFDEFRAEGADVVAIFQYTAEATQGYCASRSVPFDCLGDPLREAYNEVSMGRTRVPPLLSWLALRRLPQAVRVSRSLGGRTHGADPGQLPGTFVIDATGRIRLAHYSRTSADRPTVGAVLDAVRAAA